jgi:hypothetical protein
MTKRPKKWVFWGSLSLIPIGVVLGFIWMSVFNVFHAHEHCIKGAGLALRTYALDHHGNFPSDTNGFGNALLLLVKGDYSSIGEITGPGDGGAVFRDALKTGAPIPEEKCSRVYIQGLSDQNSPQIAILFDKKSCRGGDHFRSPWGPRLREVSLLDGSMQVIPEKNWPLFSSNQVELLVQDGFARTKAKHFFQIP